jgi:NADH:ubiquinone oxidoreductase subunit E
VDVKQTTEDGLFTVDSVRCVGACGLAPLVMVNDKIFGRVSEADVGGIVEQYLATVHDKAEV